MAPGCAPALRRHVASRSVTDARSPSYGRVVTTNREPRQIRFNAFDMNCVAHQSSGLWRHPRDRSRHYNDLSYWTDLAKLLERGGFDCLFIADVLGYYDVYGGSRDTALRTAAQAPVGDPAIPISAMAAV